jgi:hypothetical protein
MTAPLASFGAPLCSLPWPPPREWAPYATPTFCGVIGESHEDSSPAAHTPEWHRPRCYRAANRIHVGQPRGCGKLDA